ncbi:CBN-TRXR-2 protein [Caenorhabditis brenneri]|uniref:CBN-TRXR-2 protein n=1 Tax=Caenorhabditis brenneri TaxID=135651 RepID=G0NB48_CAEBE|nr:CBN-TRXR-2 protein [Caenorhabditis brenneri]
MLLQSQKHQQVACRLLSTAVQYDLIVIGGGSGGLSCSKRASELGAKVALVDAVVPSPHGTTWGIGGTCANVGCIPKKLMHQAALVGKELKYAETYGWNGLDKTKITHDWRILSKTVNDRIKGNNWVYRVQLRDKGIKYYNAFAEFVENGQVLVSGVDKNKTKTLLTAPNIVISTGLRPRYPNVPGETLGISSDDLFTLPKPPGKTLVVGAGYVALECAGFLAGLNQNVEVLIRSSPLKEFDKDCVNFVMEHLKSTGVKIREHVEVASVEETENKKKKVHFTGNGGTDEYDTVIWATGRTPRTDSLKLETVGVKKNEKSGKIVADDFDKTNIDGIFAVGDVVEGRQELTPLAIQSGKLLADRLFSDSKQTVRFDGVATTVFTPLELSTVGLTEEEAKKQYGEDGIEVFHSHFTPFEYIVPQNKDSEFCYVKAICLRDETQKVVGLHFVGPNAAEVMQGYAVAFRVGISISDLQLTIAIHPCSSEEFVKLQVTKRSGKDPRVQGCCG